jgi:hypothetical protein
MLAGHYRGHAVAKRLRPTRAEFDRLGRDFAALADRQAITQRDLAIQFQRIAELQAEIDIIRAAWSRIKAKKPVKRARAR